MLEITSGDYRLEVAPERGGAITLFEWRGMALMRPVCGPSILDVACFPLVPFSNRIGHGRFVWNGRSIALSPNFPGGDHPHPLHGFGWLSSWQVGSVEDGVIELEHACSGEGEWPWPYRARQSFLLDPEGLTLALSIENLGDEPMPAGLGLHPYFPCEADTIYRGHHTGEWQNSEDCLPLSLRRSDEPIDWWCGQPVSARSVDTVYTSRDGALEIAWPHRGIGLRIEPTDNLRCTVVYSPEQADFFCVEPVSHMTDAVNRAHDADAMYALDAGRKMMAAIRFEALEAVIACDRALTA